MEAQGIEASAYKAVPRTLVFVRHQDRILLIRRSNDRRIWPGLYNGVGGHVEAGEGLAESARREVLEETGLQVTDLQLVGLLHVTEERLREGVLVAVFTAVSVSDEVTPSTEGDLLWVTLSEASELELVPDLDQILPRVAEGDPREVFLASTTGDPSTPLRFSA